MSGIEFTLPLYSAEVYHTDYPKTNPWCRVFNYVETQGETEEEKIEGQTEAVVRLFMQDGFDPITVQAIVIEELQTLEGGDENGSSES